VRALIRSCTALLSLTFVVSGCARHYRGSVVDPRGRPVAHARVEAKGWHGSVITGEGPVTLSTVTASDGSFTVASSDDLHTFTAVSPDSKRHGSFNRGASNTPIVVVIK
jgi:hypothetical protein